MTIDQPNPEIKWMSHEDIPGVMAVEKDCFFSPWQKRDFVNCLHKKNMVCLTVKASKQTIGFIIYEKTTKLIQLVNMGVMTDYRRKKIATNLLKKICTRNPDDTVESIIANVRESNLACQLMLKSCGFRAVKIHDNYYDDTNEAAYEFVKDLKKQVLA